MKHCGLLLFLISIMVDAQNKSGGGRPQQYHDIVGTPPPCAMQSYDIVAARHRPCVALFCASTINIFHILSIVCHQAIIEFAN
jgi:hypothetical protein